MPIYKPKKIIVIMNDAVELQSMWVALDRLSSIVETASEKGPAMGIKYMPNRPTFSYSAYDKNWIDFAHENPAQVELRKLNGPTLTQKEAVLDELQAKVSDMRKEITVWKNAFFRRDKTTDDGPHRPNPHIDK